MRHLYLTTLLLVPLVLSASDIGGRLTDPSGAVVPGALIDLIAEPSDIRRSVHSSQEGTYRFIDIPSGRYRLSIHAEGFNTQLSEPFAVSGNISRDIKLTVGTIAQEVIISGSRIAELQEESPTKVEVVSRAQIRDTGYERVSDVLGEIPGVVVRSGSSGAVGGEQIQGIDSRQVLLLQDGLPIVGARGIKSGIVNLNRQDVGKLEQVEVAKGAASALYGSDAIGGVINLITREPSNPLDLNVSMSGGSLGSVDGRVDVGTRWKKLTFFTDLESHRQDAYTLLPRSQTTVGPETRRNDGLGKLRYAFNERVSLGFTASAYHNHQIGTNASEASLVKGTSNDSVQSYALVADFLPTNTTTIQARAYTSRYDENSRSDLIGSNAPSYGFANLNERYHRLDTTISQQLGRWQLLQGGYEWVQDQYRGANRIVGDNAGQQITTNDVWIQDRIQPFRNLTLTVGGRSQNHSLYGNHLVPKAGLVYRLSDRWIVRASFGKGFRAPDLGQLYYRFANPSSFYQVIGNPNLRTETSTSISAGVMYRAQRYRVGVNLFRHNLNDLIDSYVAGTPTTPQQMAALLARYGIPATFSPLLNRMTFIYLNLNRAYTQGFELDGDVSLTRQLRMQAAYTFLQAEDRATGLLLPQRHKHQGYVKAEYDNSRWGLLANVRGTFFSKWPLSPDMGTYAYGYRVWDVYASKFLPGGLQLFGAIDNLADSRDRKLTGAMPTFDRPDYGRTARIGLRFALVRRE